ncbi:MAG: glutamate--tRNA ligase, partial [Methanobacterium sp.]
GDVYLVKNDIEENKLLRLMDAVNIIFQNGKAIYKGSDFEEARKMGAKIIHWIPAHDNLKADVVMPDASIINGLVEPYCHNLKVGDVVQFERFGFARLDEIRDDKLIFYFAHK